VLPRAMAPALILIFVCDGCVSGGKNSCLPQWQNIAVVVNFVVLVILIDFVIDIVVAIVNYVDVDIDIVIVIVVDNVDNVVIVVLVVLVVHVVVLIDIDIDIVAVVIDDAIMIQALAIWSCELRHLAPGCVALAVWLFGGLLVRLARLLGRRLLARLLVRLLVRLLGRRLLWLCSAFALKPLWPCVMTLLPMMSRW
jgi:hypothetical protein